MVSARGVAAAERQLTRPHQVVQRPPKTRNKVASVETCGVRPTALRTRATPNPSSTPLCAASRR